MLKAIGKSVGSGALSPADEEARARAAHREWKADLEETRRDFFFFFQTYDLANMSRQLIDGAVVSVVRFFTKFEAAIRLGHRVQRSGAGRLSDVYPDAPDRAMRALENMYLSGEQLDDHFDLLGGRIEYGAEAALNFTAQQQV